MFRFSVFLATFFVYLCCFAQTTVNLNVYDTDNKLIGVASETRTMEGSYFLSAYVDKKKVLDIRSEISFGYISYYSNDKLIAKAYLLEGTMYNLIPGTNRELLDITDRGEFVVVSQVSIDPNKLDPTKIPPGLCSVLCHSEDVRINGKQIWSRLHIFDFNASSILIVIISEGRTFILRRSQ